MQCPVCGSKNTVDDEYGGVIGNVCERRLTCDDCDSQFWQEGYLDSEGYIDYWDKTPFKIEPSEQGEKIIAEKQEYERIKSAQRLTIPMFQD